MFRALHARKGIQLIIGLLLGVPFGFFLQKGGVTRYDVIIGSFISAMLSGQFHLEWVPSKWAAAFGNMPFVRWVVAFIGGIIIGIGARWAGGCTSGHGISGTLQLAISSWLAGICFFIGGILTAMLIF